MSDSESRGGSGKGGYGSEGGGRGPVEGEGGGRGGGTGAAWRPEGCKRCGYRYRWWGGVEQGVVLGQYYGGKHSGIFGILQFEGWGIDEHGGGGVISGECEPAKAEVGGMGVRKGFETFTKGGCSDAHSTNVLGRTWCPSKGGTSVDMGGGRGGAWDFPRAGIGGR
eukprot:765026-Hanusia_phi.AAC.4